jgi:hypothetical protein
MIKKQALIEFAVGEDRFETIFLISAQLIKSAILGSAFAREYGITIAFAAKCFYYENEGSGRGHSFEQSSASLDSRRNEQESKGDPSRSCCRVTHDFLSPFRQVSGLYLKIRPRPLRSISFPIHYSGHVGAKVVSRLLPTVGAHNSIPGLVMWELWWANWQWGSSVSIVSFRSINSSIFINNPASVNKQVRKISIRSHPVIRRRTCSILNSYRTKTSVTPSTGTKTPHFVKSLYVTFVFL